MNDDFFVDKEITPLVRALMRTEPPDVIEEILQRSPELAQQNVKGRYPMSHAVVNGSPVEVVEALFNCWRESLHTKDLTGVDYSGTWRDWRGWTPLHHACDRTPVEAVQFLVDAYPEALQLRNEQNSLPVHTTIEHGATEAAVRAMVERSPESLLQTDGKGRLPIHLAVIKAVEADPASGIGLVEYLADQCPQFLGALEEGGLVQGAGADRFRHISKLPIHHAAETPGPNQLRVIQVLVNRCPECVGLATEYKSLPIHFAAATPSADQLAITQLLVDRCPESLLATDTNGHLPVHVALRSRPGAGVIQRLLVETIPDETRLGLMHFAVRRLEIVGPDSIQTPSSLLRNVSELADALPATLRERNAEGSLPIHVAVSLLDSFVLWHRSTPTVDPLVASLVGLHPESLSHRNDAGEIPLHIALNRRDALVTATFLFERAPNSALVPARDGDFLIHTALSNQWFGLVERIVELVPPASRGQDARGRTPMHIAASLNVPNASQSLAMRAAEALVQSCPESLLICDNDSNLPIHVAVECIVPFLIEHSPESLHVAGAGGRLPLHVAVSKMAPSPALVQLIVDTWDGAVDTRDANGILPLQLALANQATPVAVTYALVRAKPDLLLRVVRSRATTAPSTIGQND